MHSSDRATGTDDGTDVERMAIRDRKRRELEQRISASAQGEPIFVDGEGHFAELLSQHRLVLVDFYADWCGPCKMLDPIVSEVAADSPAVVAKVDVDHHQSIAASVGVRGVPTLLLYVDGEATERLVGVQDRARILDLIDRQSS